MKNIFLLNYTLFVLLQLLPSRSSSQSVVLRDGKITSIGKVNKTDSCNLKQGTWVYDYDEEYVKVVDYVNDTIEGTVKIFRLEDSKLLHEEQYFKGKLNGFYIDYDEFSEINQAVLVQYYKDGRLHGTEKVFYNGNIRKETDYKKGLKDGIIKTYYENGQLWSVSSLKAGSYRGAYTYYYKNGNLHLEGDSQNLSPQKTYTKAGKLKMIRLFDSTGKYSKTEYYNKNGELKTVKKEKKLLKSP